MLELVWYKYRKRQRFTSACQQNDIPSCAHPWEDVPPTGTTGTQVNIPSNGTTSTSIFQRTKLCLHEDFFKSVIHQLQQPDYNDSSNCYDSSFQLCYVVVGTNFELLSTLDNHGENDNNFSIVCTNDDIANGRVIAADNKQLKAQNNQVETTVPSKVQTDTNNAVDNAKMIATIAKHIDAQNDKEEETIYHVIDSYDSYNINSTNDYLQ